MIDRDSLQRVSSVRWIGLAAGAIVTVVAGLALVGGESEVRYSGIPRLDFPLPRVSGGPTEGGGEAAARTTPRAPATVRPGSIDPALIEAGSYGPLPRVGPDGGRPAVVYARPVDASDGRPRIAIILAGLGLQREITQAAVALPGPVTLHFSPYAPDLAELIKASHQAGHEVLLDLPMEPLDYPHSDPGPHTLLAAASTEGNLDRLLWLLARSAGYFGVTGSGGRFARSAQAVPILHVLAERGLALIEFGGAELQVAAEEVGLPYAHAGPPIDDVPSSRPIDQALAALESEALESGSALGLAQTYPVTLERLQLWTATLAERNLHLVPASALVPGRAGRAATLDGGGGAVDHRS